MDTPFLRCEHCLRTERPSGGVCPACGYDGVPRNLHPMLPEGTPLNGRYILGRAEGQGGFSICYRAWDGMDNGIVAIKELFPESFATRDLNGTVYVDYAHQPGFDDAMRSMQHEAEVLQKLANEPAIVKVRDFFIDNDTAYLAADFLRGQPYDQYLLSEYQRHHAHLSIPGAVNVALRVAGALAAVHAHGLLHLDVKPSNIRAVEGNQFILLDFGSARDAFRRDNQQYGRTYTPAYSAPEQYDEFGTTSQATDVYGLAATLYYSLSLEVPVRADERAAGVPLAPLSSLNPMIPVELEAIIEKAMSLDAADRYESVLELAKALKPFGAIEDGKICKEPTAQPLRNTLSVRRFVAWTLDAVYSLLATAVLVFMDLLPSNQVVITLVLMWWATQFLALFTQATPGMQSIKLRFVDRAGGPIRFRSILVHTILLTPPMCLLLIQFRAHADNTLRQDRFSGSRVEMKTDAD